MVVANRFLNNTGGINDPGWDAQAVVVGTDFLTAARALYIGSVGDVSVVTANGSTVTFVAVPTGTILPIRCTKVSSATASSIVAIT